MHDTVQIPDTPFTLFTYFPSKHFCNSLWFIEIYKKDAAYLYFNLTTKHFGVRAHAFVCARTRLCVALLTIITDSNF
jgi:hypothetical protein